MFIIKEMSLAAVERDGPYWIDIRAIDTDGSDLLIIGPTGETPEDARVYMMILLAQALQKLEEVENKLPDPATDPHLTREEHQAGIKDPDTPVH